MKDTRQLKVFSLAVNEVELKQCSWHYNVEPYSNIIIPTPLSCGGCVIVGLETITYYNKDYHKSIPLAKVCNFPCSVLDTVYSIPLAKACIRAETNTRFTRIFAQLHKYSNTKRVFGHLYRFSALTLTFFVIKHISRYFSN